MAAPKINQRLKKAIDKMVKEVMSGEKDDNGKPLYSLTDKCKVVDRALKLAAIEAKADDAGYGAGFGADDKDEDDDD